MSKLLYIFLAIGIAFIGYRLHRANSDRAGLVKQYSEMSSSYESLQKDDQKVKSDIKYYSDPHNLEKELRSQFNYRAPNEKMIIVIPSGN